MKTFGAQYKFFGAQNKFFGAHCAVQVFAGV